MAANMKKQIAKAETLSKALEELESKLEPLLSHSLSETTSSLDSLQQAKLHVLLSYLINDLIFIYLKTRGVDPKTHPVTAELDRVRQYFGKIKDAEESNKKRPTEVDKAAAGRFIKHAISEARKSAISDSMNVNEAGPSKPQPSTPTAVRVTEKMREREEYHRKLAEEEENEEEEEVLEVIDDSTHDKASESSKEKGKGVERENKVVEPVEVATESRKKRRRPMDPFGTFGEEATQAAAPDEKRKKKRKHKKVVAVIDDDATTGSRASSDIDVAGRESGSKKKRPKKKNREDTT